MNKYGEINRTTSVLSEAWVNTILPEVCVFLESEQEIPLEMGVWKIASYK